LQPKEIEMNGQDEDLSDAEKSALAALRQSVPPPGTLEPKLLEALRARNLVGEKASGIRSGRAIALTGAAAVLFGLGLWAGSRFLTRAPVASANSSSRYVLLLEGPADPPPEEEARRVEEYKLWARSVARSGHAISGEKLEPEVLLLGPDNESTGAKESIRGFFVIGARDDGEALEIARGCPHLRYGGAIVVRRIAPV
jgi:hypothetical protein